MARGVWTTVARRLQVDVEDAQPQRPEDPNPLQEIEGIKGFN